MLASFTLKRTRPVFIYSSKCLLESCVLWKLQRKQIKQTYMLMGSISPWFSSLIGCFVTQTGLIHLFKKRKPWVKEKMADCTRKSECCKQLLFVSQIVKGNYCGNVMDRIAKRPGSPSYYPIMTLLCLSTSRLCVHRLCVFYFIFACTNVDF